MHHTTSRVATSVNPQSTNGKDEPVQCVKPPQQEHGLCHFIQLAEQDDPTQSRSELLVGLTAAQAFISPKFLYDALGSKLFEAICELPEYYLTRTEKLIFEEYAADIARIAGTGSVLIDLGAGNCVKAKRLFPHLQPKQYVPVDISIEFLRDAVNNLQQQFPSIRMLGLGMDFSSGLELPAAVQSDNRLFFWPGSSISNFPPEHSLSFLRRLHDLCVQEGTANGGALISADLVKDTSVLKAAYDDALGVTSSFNLNVLRRLNHLIGADFDLKKWRHRSYFNTAHNRIEMYLEASVSQTVHWSLGERHFKAGDRIHTESSYKYTRQGFVALLKQAGFENVVVWTDPQEWFMVCHARASSSRSSSEPQSDSCPRNGK